jgi:hypothetical protein
VTVREAEDLARRVYDGAATAEEVELVIELVVVELLLSDYDATVEWLRGLERRIRSS